MVRIMKKLLLLTIFLLAAITIGSVYAIPFTYEYKSVTEDIWNNESAYYDLTITNNNDYPDKFQIYTISSFWDASPTLIEIASLSSQVISLEIAPLDSKLYGPQLVPITIKSVSDGYFKTENFYLYVKPSSYTPQEYITNVAMEVRLPEETDPRDPMSLEVYIRNRNPSNLDDLRIVVESELFNKEYLTSLSSLEEKTNQILFADLNPLQKPGTYDVSVKLLYKNDTVSQSTKQVLIKEYSDIQIEQTATRKIFSKTEKISLYNDGNNDALKLIKLKKNFFEKIFTTGSAKYVPLTENGISYITWNVPLKPRESYTITVKTDYTLLALFVILVIVIIISYYIFRSPVILFKNAKITSMSEEGVSDIKVKLHIKNRSGRTLKNIKIIDKYPKLVILQEESSLGNIKPTKMLSADKSNNLLMWNLDVLEPFEERLMVYRLKSELNIVGNISLPAAKIKFHTATGERSYMSNKIKLLHKSHSSIGE